MTKRYPSEEDIARKKGIEIASIMIPKPMLTKIESLVESAAYSRDFCSDHRIDYCDIKHSDILRIKEIILMEYIEYASFTN